MVLDAAKEGSVHNHRAILENELHTVGLRLNQDPPDIYFKVKPSGGVSFNTTLPLTKLGPNPKDTVYKILKEYKIHNAEVLFKEDADVDQFIDVVEGNRKYVKCLYVYNKIDMVSLEQVDELARRPNSIVISCNLKLNLDRLLEYIWEYLGLVRVYTKKKGNPPNFSEPIVLTRGRNGVTVQAACASVHKEMISNFKYAMVWGTSAKHCPQRCGLSHELHDQDVLQIAVKTAEEQRHDKNYGDKVQAYYKSYHEKKKKKAKLKT
ncbi:Developmentally-regulated GTP-binding protein 2 [Balamuthia mandrillaris]